MTSASASAPASASATFLAKSVTESVLKETNVKNIINCTNEEKEGFPLDKKRHDRPLSLKQRTSSVDTRPTYSRETWWSLRDLVKWKEYLIPVNNFSIWRRHLNWALQDGEALIQYNTQRYNSCMVFMSLLLSAELSVLFNSAEVTTAMRHELQRQNLADLKFLIGICLLVSIFLTIFSLITTFTAWGMVSAISKQNAHALLRSSIGQYVGELPHRFITAAIYSFLIWILLFIFELLTVGFWSILLVTIVAGLFLHVVFVFSGFGRLILHSSAMSSTRIFEEHWEAALMPRDLQHELHERSKAELHSQISITRQYLRPATPLDGKRNLQDLVLYLQECRQHHVPAEDEPRRRADSTVRFADHVDYVPNMESFGSRTSSRTSSPAMMMTARDTLHIRQLSQTSSLGSVPREVGISLPPPPDGTPLSTHSMDAWLSGTPRVQLQPVDEHDSHTVLTDQDLDLVLGGSYSYDEQQRLLGSHTVSDYYQSTNTTSGMQNHQQEKSHV